VALLRARGLLGLLMPFALTVVGALLTSALSGDQGLSGRNQGAVLTVLVTVCALAGQALTYNNLVSEYEITAREYRTGLSPGALVLAKFTVFGVIAIVQGVLAALVFCAVRGGPPDGLLAVDPVIELMLPLCAVALASMALGLALSALASTAEKAVGLVTVASIAQVALNAYLFELMGPLQVLGALVPSRWAFAATAASLDLGRPPGRTDALWGHSIDRLGIDLAMLLLLAGIFTAVAWLLLRRRLLAGRS
jgi:ABC-type multidrug transport system permease subunit